MVRQDWAATSGGIDGAREARALGAEHGLDFRKLKEAAGQSETRVSVDCLLAFGLCRGLWRQELEMTASIDGFWGRRDCVAGKEGRGALRAGSFDCGFWLIGRGWWRMVMGLRVISTVVLDCRSWIGMVEIGRGMPWFGAENGGF
ncbi:hypothetical protein M0R45_026506 [Rubus argutus]|uniref:Uncharacterized protein n=1 Tax=Rubus argutus TaxID=59490 RepID=A0AAW1WZ05_RUBAR